MHAIEPQSVWNKFKEKTITACLAATLIALCVRVCYTKPTYKNNEWFHPKPNITSPPP